MRDFSQQPVIEPDLYLPLLKCLQGLLLPSGASPAPAVPVPLRSCSLRSGHTTPCGRTAPLHTFFLSSKHLHTQLVPSAGTVLPVRLPVNLCGSSRTPLQHTLLLETSSDPASILYMVGWAPSSSLCWSLHPAPEQGSACQSLRDVGTLGVRHGVCLLFSLSSQY